MIRCNSVRLAVQQLLQLRDRVGEFRIVRQVLVLFRIIVVIVEFRTLFAVVPFMLLSFISFDAVAPEFDVLEHAANPIAVPITANAKNRFIHVSCLIA